MLQLTRSDIQLTADTILNGNMDTKIENIHVMEGTKMGVFMLLICFHGYRGNFVTKFIFDAYIMTTLKCLFPLPHSLHYQSKISRGKMLLIDDC